LEGTSVPTLDAVVSRSTNGQQIFIKIVNTDPLQAIPTQILITGAHITKRAQIETLNTNELKASNDFTHPDSVHLSSTAIAAGPTFTITLPEHSVSVVTIDIDR
jgi:alpha-N-arabinofuranosidase